MCGHWHLQSCDLEKYLLSSSLPLPQQPLHVSFLSDLGGNKITGNFFNDSWNLHSVRRVQLLPRRSARTWYSHSLVPLASALVCVQIWDTAIIKQRLSRDFNDDQSQYISYLLAGITPANATSWAKCFTDPKPDPLACAGAWAQESAALACTYAYRCALSRFPAIGPHVLRLVTLLLYPPHEAATLTARTFKRALIWARRTTSARSPLSTCSCRQRGV